MAREVSLSSFCSPSETVFLHLFGFIGRPPRERASQRVPRITSRSVRCRGRSRGLDVTVRDKKRGEKE